MKIKKMVCLLMPILLLALNVPDLVFASAPVRMYEDFNYDNGMFTQIMAGNAVNKGFASGWTSSHIDKDYTQIINTPYGKALQITDKGLTQFDFSTKLPEAFNNVLGKDYYFSYIAYVENSGTMSGLYSQKVQIRDATTYAGIMYDATNGVRPIIRWGTAKYPSERKFALSKGNYYKVVYKYHSVEGVVDDLASIMVYPADANAPSGWDLSVQVKSPTSWNSDAFTISTGASVNIDNSIGDVKVDIYDSGEQIKNLNAENAVLTAYNAILNGESSSQVQNKITTAQTLIAELQNGIVKDTQNSAINGLNANLNRLLLVEQTEKETSTLDDVGEAGDAVNEINTDDKLKAYFTGRLIVSEKYVDAKTSVEVAEASKAQSDIDTAKAKINNLSSGSQKVYLQNRMDILTAEIAVATAENLKTVEAIDGALLIVNMLPAGSQKDSFLARLDIIRASIAGAVAEEKVVAAETSKKQSDVDLARQWVSSLIESNLKTQLNHRLDRVQALIDATVPTISNVKIQGVLRTGSTVSVTFDITDNSGNSDTPEIKWYIADKLSDAFTKLPSETDKLLITDNYVGKYIRAEITPKNTKNVYGTPVLDTVMISKSAVIVIEDFNYTGAIKLNESTSALLPDLSKGFSTGWTGSIDLSSTVADIFTIGGNKTLQSATANSVGIYRGLAKPIDTNEKGVYYIKWKMMLNSGATNVKDRNQKLIFTQKGVTTSASQLNFGFIADRQGGGSTDKYYAPYMRATSFLTYFDNFRVMPGQMYEIIVKIETDSEDADKVMMKIYPEGQAHGNSWDMTGEISMGQTFDTIGYVSYTSGSTNNAFGDLTVEHYNSNDADNIQSVEGLMGQAKNLLSLDLLSQARALINQIPEGVLKTTYYNESVSIEALIAAQSQLIETINAEIAILTAREVTISNYAKTLEDIVAVEAKINTVENTERKEQLTVGLKSIKNKTESVSIEITRVKELFNYPSGTLLNTTGADLQNCWNGGWFADKELLIQLPTSSVVRETGSYSFANAEGIYRSMAYGFDFTKEKTYYVKWNAVLQNGGSTALTLGDYTFGISDKPFIEYSGGIVRGNIVISPNIEYTIVTRIDSREVSIMAYPSSQGPTGLWSAKSDVNLNGNISVFGIKGENSTIKGIIKEEYSKEYVYEVEQAMKTMVNSKSITDINAALGLANGLASSIVKELVTASANVIKAVRLEIVPEIISVGINGVGKSGNTLTASYSINDIAKNAGPVTVNWYVGGKLSSSGNNFTISSDYEGKSIVCEIITSNEFGKKSEPVRSQPLQVSSGSGGSVGGGGGNSYKPVINEPIYFPDDNTSIPGKPTFNDIQNHWAKSSIEKLAGKGIVKGKDINEFSPDANITRAEFVSLVVRALNLKADAQSDGYNDVNKDMWYFDTVTVATAVGLVSGSDGFFYPDNNLTREEMAKMIVSAYKYYNKSETLQSTDTNFTDSNLISDWGIEFVKQASALNLIKGMEDGSFAPKADATRAQSVVVIERLLKL